ncbi:hypothetical protein VCR3J2_530104 [Vibrio coralliirubri]|uniref:hypothetical protein n=1 Tax=Vibrio coralliirubri TaxID=1516159 RepID=UPI0006316D41|nr:hypothetical protein [Vibrio coralliirubri]CDU01496.1 hypothetical protein VCR3J2_530104 [Vibrio coralliirubri]
MESEVGHVVDYTVLISTVLTGCFTLGAVFLTNRINSSQNEKLLAQANEKERNRERLLKAEQLYVKFDKWSSSLSSVCFKALCFSEVVEQSKILGKSMENTPMVKDEYIEIKMLVDIHFPELKPELDLVLTARNKCVELVATLKKGCALSKEQLQNEMTTFEAACNSFKQQVASVASSR